MYIRTPCFSFFFFFNDTATTEIYTLSLHDALPISWPRFARWLEALASLRGPDLLRVKGIVHVQGRSRPVVIHAVQHVMDKDRKSTRLNSSHQIISYAVFCLKKKKEHIQQSRVSLAD